MSLVRNIAGRIRKRLPASVEMDDLVQTGLIGLNEALSRFEKGPDSNFESYAARRIEGAMLDALRAGDSLPREARSRLRAVRAAVQRLEHLLGRPPRAQEVANELSWSLEKFHSCMVEAGVGGVRSGEHEREHREDVSSSTAATEHGHPVDHVHADPMHALQQRQRNVALSVAYDALEEAERFVMESIYDRGIALRDIGETLGVSESRVSQMSAEIVAKLKRRMREW